MNELEFIRSQIALEYDHAAAVRTACSAALGTAAAPAPAGEFLDVCANYLVFADRRGEIRDTAHLDLLRPQIAAGEREAQALLGELQRSLPIRRSALDRLAAAIDTHRTAAVTAAANQVTQAAPIEALLHDYLASHAGVHANQRALLTLCDVHYDIVQWRQAAGVDADSILEERERYARVVASLPDGLMA